MRDPVGRGQLGIGRTDAQAVHPAAARRYEQGASLANQPDAERSALEDEPGLEHQVASAVVDEVPEQTESSALGVGFAWPASRFDDIGAAVRVELRDRPRMAKQ